MNILKGHYQGVNTVAITPDGQVVVSTQSYELIIWDLNTGKILKKTTKYTEYSYRNVNAIFPDGQKIVSASSSFHNYGLTIWDLWSEERIGTFIGHNEDVTAIAITSNGEKIVSASGDKTIIIWNSLTGKKLKILRGHNSTVKGIAISPDEKHLISVSSDRTIKVWNFETGEIMTSFSADSDVHCCAIAPDGVTIIVGEWSGRVHFLRLELPRNSI